VFFCRVSSRLSFSSRLQASSFGMIGAEQAFYKRVARSSVKRKKASCLHVNKTCAHKQQPDNHDSKEINRLLQIAYFNYEI
jgi:hypothetical protein